MPTPNKQLLPALLSRHAERVLQEWIKAQLAASTRRSDLVRESDLRNQSQRFIGVFTDALGRDVGEDPRTPAWAPVQDFLSELSDERARSGFTPSEMATFVFSLKEPLFNLLRDNLHNEPDRLVEQVWMLTVLLDKLGLYTTEVAQKKREDLIQRQQHELLELSTPVVELWDGVLALPLIGTLDSERTQVVMESLLTKIVETGSAIAIIDITGVPTVDTLVAQHLLKTVAAARLMGAECIVSGIRPQIAQTIVHLGVDLSGVATKATLASALALAMDRRRKGSA
jgi:rsbT co-antagonist protein RsbR